MTAEQFASWVEGYLAAKAGSPLSAEDAQVIASKARTIVPSFVPWTVPANPGPYLPMQPFISMGHGELKFDAPKFKVGPGMWEC